MLTVSSSSATASATATVCFYDIYDYDSIFIDQQDDYSSEGVIPNFCVYNFTSQYEHIIHPEIFLQITQGKVNPEQESEILRDRMRR